MNRITRTLIALTLGALIAAATVLGLSAPAVADTSRVMIDHESVSAAMWDVLIADGYTGSPTDHREALYPTRVDAVAACHTDTDCLIAVS